MLGYPGSEAEELYTKIAEVLMEESMSEEQRAACAIHFNSLTFNTTTGSAVYDSLTKGNAAISNNNQQQ